MRVIEVDLDVYGAIWTVRTPEEASENDVLRRVFKLDRNPTVVINKIETGATTQSLPSSIKWTDVLIWTLRELGGRAHLSDIYVKSREARRLLSSRPTREHDAAARECLESHCSESAKYRGKQDLFYMPEGKGAGVWALR